MSGPCETRERRALAKGTPVIAVVDMSQEAHVVRHFKQLLNIATLKTKECSSSQSEAGCSVLRARRTSNASSLCMTIT